MTIDTATSHNHSFTILTVQFYPGSSSHDDVMCVIEQNYTRRVTILPNPNPSATSIPRQQCQSPNQMTRAGIRWDYHLFFITTEFSTQLDINHHPQPVPPPTTTRKDNMYNGIELLAYIELNHASSLRKFCQLRKMAQICQFCPFFQKKWRESSTIITTYNKTLPSPCLPHAAQYPDPTPHHPTQQPHAIV